MGSPITFSGFNNIDFGSIVTALMQQASAPLTALQNNQKDLQSQINGFSTLATRMSGLTSAASALGSLSSVSAFSGSSSDSSAVSVSAGSNATAGHYDVKVTSLATSQVTVSTSSAPDASTTVVASGGTLTIGGVDVAISGDVTLTGLASAINSTADIGVTATVIRTAPGTYRLSLTSRESGADNAFAIANNLSGGSGVTFAGNAVDAGNASLTINNIPVESDSNVLENVMPGVTLTLLKADPAATVAVDIAADSAGLKAKLESFISSYNSLVKFVDDQRVASAKGDTTSIGGNPLLGQLRSALRSTLLGVHGSGELTRLSQAGIEFTQQGTLQLNETMFDAAVASHPEDVQSLFAGDAGGFSAVESLLNEYSPSTGFISNANTQLTAQIRRMDVQIAAMQDRLASQRLALQQEFAAADAAISQLRNQSASLAGFGSNLGSSL